MPYCPHCGVEVDSDTQTCPLCKTPLPSIDTKPIGFGEYPDREHKLHYQRRRFTNRERFSALHFILFILLIPFTVTLSTDLLLHGEITWSIFPIVSLLGAFAICACSLFVRNVWKLLSSYLLIALIIALLFHMITGTLGSFLRWSLPITLVATAITVAAIIYGAKAKSRGFNIAGVSLWAVALFCLVLDAIIAINRGTSQKIHGWSVITGSALFPLGALFFYVHYRFGGRISFKRFFNA